MPVPVFQTKWTINDSTLTAGVIPAVEKIAKKNNLPVIDLYHQMHDQGENFFDGIHPNEKGAEIMAVKIAEDLKGVMQ